MNFKKWNMFYLVLTIILFIFLLIPFFQNAALPAPVIFFASRSTFTSIYLPLIFVSMVEWALLLLYIQSLFSDYKRQDATKFDLK